MILALAIRTNWTGPLKHWRLKVHGKGYGGPAFRKAAARALNGLRHAYAYTSAVDVYGALAYHAVRVEVRAAWRNACGETQSLSKGRA